MTARIQSWVRLCTGPDGGLRRDHCEWSVAGKGGGPATGRGSLEQAAAACRGRVGVLVPGADCLLTRVRVPGARRQVRQAVPYALEERLADDVEDLHFALGPRQPDGAVTVAVVREARLRAWMEALAEAGLRPDRAVPESLALPVRAGEWVVLLEPGRALVRCGAAQAYAVDGADLSAFLAQALEQARSEEGGPDGSAPALPQRLRVVAAGGESAGLESLCAEAGVAVEWATHTGPALAALDPAVAEVDLLQGAFDRRAGSARQWRRWRAAVALLAAVVGLQGMLLVGEYRRLQAEERALTGRIEAVYREAFPEARRVVNPRVQMERRLAALRGGTPGGGVVDLLARCGPVLQATEGLVLRGLRYREGALELDATLADLGALDGLQQALDRQPGLTAEVGTASARGDRVEVRLRIGREDAG